ncbi:MAG: LysE family transporter [Firmicutes bacterium]|nr:LysE family transporter [Bacillota bacterium]
MGPEMFLKGLLFGFSIAAPVGPIGVLTIRRTLSDGRAAGFFTGLGAATADAVYGSVGGFGITLIADCLISQRFWLGLLGGIFLCYLGIRTFLAAPSDQASDLRSKGLLGSYLSTFLLTLANPMTILSFTAAFTGLGLANQSGSYQNAGLLVAGVFLGSTLWWFMLSGGVSRLRDRFDQAGLRWVNRVSGAIICGFGMIALYSLI